METEYGNMLMETQVFKILFLRVMFLYSKKLIRIMMYGINLRHWFTIYQLL